MGKIKTKLANFFTTIDAFFNKINTYFLTFFRKHYLWIVFIVIFLCSIVVRIAFLEYLSGDMYYFLLSWFAKLRSGGGLKALGSYPWVDDTLTRTGDYPLAYINLLALLSYIPGEGIVLIKVLSIIFDYVLAFGALLIVREFTKNKFYLLISFTVFVFFPTSILNSAVWGQADQMYSALVVWAFWLLLRNRPSLAMFPLGFAVAMKLQAVFFLPVLIFMWLAGRFKLRYMLIIPFVMFITFLPAYDAGAPFTMPFAMYVNQVGSMYRNANYGAGSMYAFLEMSSLRDGLNNGAAVTFAFIAVGVALLVLYHYNVAATNKNLVYVATLFVLLVPFVLPHMHERYFYMADAFVIIYVLALKRKYLLGLLMSFSSVLTYTHFLTGHYIFGFLGADSVRLAALINAGIIIFLIYEGRRILEKPSDVDIEQVV